MLAVAIALCAAALLAAALLYLTQPLGAVRREPPAVRADPDRLLATVRQLCTGFGARDAAQPQNLARAADFIAAGFAAAGARVEPQEFAAGGASFRNVRAFVGPPCAADGERIVVGAHYDTCGPFPGADDDASGVAGLLELARLFSAERPPMPVELVAFALEEPPFFRTPSMGSAVHARALAKCGARVRAMLSLEMIGCFRDEPGSQSYPAPLLGWLYPTQGDFIALVGCVGQAGLVRRVKQSMAGVGGLPVRSINAPRLLPGIDFSDHLNYWDAGFPAAMVTDTAFCRNLHYHGPGDTPDRLDPRRMAEVVTGVAAAVLELAR